MDKIAIISDVHGNITALNTVLNDIHSRNINKIFCLGDSIVKCANPDLVVDTLQKYCEVILKGNCDDNICNPNVDKDRYWSRRKIGEERAHFLYSLPVSHEFYMSGYLIRLFHASPFDLTSIFNPMQFINNPNSCEKAIINPEDMFQNTKFIGKSENDPIPDIIGYGHLHTPNLFRYKNKCIFNTGSIGIPIELHNGNYGDTNNRFSTVSSYTILEGDYESKDLSSISITHIRIPYDISKEIEYLKNSDMPTRNEIIHDLQTASHISNLL